MARRKKINDGRKGRKEGKTTKTEEQKERKKRTEKNELISQLINTLFEKLQILNVFFFKFKVLFFTYSLLVVRKRWGTWKLPE